MPLQLPVLLGDATRLRLGVCERLKEGLQDGVPGDTVNQVLTDGVSDGGLGESVPVPVCEAVGGLKDGVGVGVGEGLRLRWVAVRDQVGVRVRVGPPYVSVSDPTDP